MSSKYSTKYSRKYLSKDSPNKSIQRISPRDGKNKTRRIAEYVSRIAYKSTIGAIKKGKIPIVDPLIVEPMYRKVRKMRGITDEVYYEGIEKDKREVNDFVSEVNDFVSRITKRKVGGKRSNKTRKNGSRKNRK
jgi:hypothetical protein